MFKKSVSILLCFLMIFMSVNWTVIAKDLSNNADTEQSQTETIEEFLTMNSLESQDVMVTKNSSSESEMVQSNSAVDNFVIEPGKNYKIENLGNEDIEIGKDNFYTPIDYSQKVTSSGNYKSCVYNIQTLSIKIEQKSTMYINLTNAGDSAITCTVPSGVLGGTLSVNECENPALCLYTIEPEKNYSVENMTKEELKIYKDDFYNTADNAYQSTVTGEFKNYDYNEQTLDYTIPAKNRLNINVTAGKELPESFKLFVPYEWNGDKIILSERENPALCLYTIDPEKNYSLENTTKEKLKIQKDDFYNTADRAYQSIITGEFKDYAYNEQTLDYTIPAKNQMNINVTEGKELPESFKLFVPYEWNGDKVIVSERENPALCLYTIEPEKNYSVENTTKEELKIQKDDFYNTADRAYQSTISGEYKDYAYNESSLGYTIPTKNRLNINVTAGKELPESFKLFVPYEWNGDKVILSERENPALCLYTIEPEKNYTVENTTKEELKIQKDDFYNTADRALQSTITGESKEYAYNERALDYTIPAKNRLYINITAGKELPESFKLFVPYEWNGDKVVLSEHENPALYCFTLEPLEAIIFNNSTKQNYQIGINQGTYKYTHKNALGKLIDQGSDDANNITLDRNKITIIQNPRDSVLKGYFPYGWTNDIKAERSDSPEDYSPAYIEYTLKRQLSSETGETLQTTDISVNYEITAFNKTKNKSIMLVDQAPYLFFNSSEIKAGDTIAVTLKHKKDETQEETFDVVMGADNKAKAGFSVIDKGGIKATLRSENKDQSPVGIFFDESGNRVYTVEAYSNGNLQQMYLPQGKYTLMAMIGSSYLWRLENLQSYVDFGLVEGQHYVKQEFTVQNGRIQNLGEIKVPSYDESVLSFLDREQTSIATNVDSSYAGGLIEVRIAYAFKETNQNITNSEIVLTLPKAADLSGESIVLNGERVADYQINGQQVSIPVSGRSGVLKLFIKPNASMDLKTDAEIQFTSKNKILKETIGTAEISVPVVTLNTNTVTNTKDIEVSGAVDPGKYVVIYDGDIEIGTIMALKNGTYQGKVSLNKPYEGSVHAIKASVYDIEKDASTVVSQQVTYKTSGAVLTAFKAFVSEHGSIQEFDLLKEDTDKELAYFWPLDPMTFSMKYENSDKIESVYVTSQKNGETKKIKAVYDRQKDEWIASGFFDPNNKNYVPGILGTECELKNEEIIVDLNQQINLKEEKEKLPDIWKGSTATNVTQTGNTYTADLVLADDAHTTIPVEYKYQQTTNYTAKDDSKIVADGYKKIKTVDGTKAFCRIETKDTGYTYSIVQEVKDTMVETSVSMIINGLDLGFGGTYGVLSDVGSYASDVMKIQSAALEAQSQEELDQYYKLFQLYTAVTLTKVVTIAAFAAVPGFPILGLFAITVGIEALSSAIFDASLDGIKQRYRSQGTNTLRFVIDPSGFTYEAVASNRLSGVKATIYYKNEKGEIVQWKAEEYGQQNPLLTDSQGKYRWDVPEGEWQVKYEKEGYETTYSDWLPVPPPQMDVNIGLVDKSAPAVQTVNSYPEYIEIIFDKYMDISSITKDSLKVEANGKEVPVSLAFADEEASPNDPTKTYGKILHVSYDQNRETGAVIGVKIAKTVKNYCGTEMLRDYAQNANVSIQPLEIQAPDTLSIEYGKDQKIDVQVLPVNSAGGKKITVAGCSFITLDKTELRLDASGKASFTAKGYLPGEGTLTLKLEGTTLQKTINVKITPKADIKIIKGDLNGSGSVDIMDARKAKRAAMKEISLTENELAAADLNGDGKVDIMEARKIKRAAMKEIVL